jgi:hypothetical protein
VKAERADSERRGPKGYDDDFDRGRYSAASIISTTLRELFKNEDISLE